MYVSPRQTDTSNDECVNRAWVLRTSTARHPQTLLATHFHGQPLTVDHGAPLRLLVPVKLGLKNVKAIAKITYSAEEPSDYWAERGYSRYDGI